MTTLQAKLAYKIRKVRSKNYSYCSSSTVIRSKFRYLHYGSVEKRLRVYAIRLRRMNYMLRVLLEIRDCLKEGKSDGLGDEIFE